MGKLALIFLLAASTVNAKPHHWYQSKMNWTLIGAAAGSTLFATKEIHDCRLRNDLIHCPDGGYGPFHAREGLRGGISIVTAAMTIYGREHWTQGWRNELINDSPVAVWSSWNVAVGLSDRSVANYPREDETRFRVKH